MKRAYTYVVRKELPRHSKCVVCGSIAENKYGRIRKTCSTECQYKLVGLKFKDRHSSGLMKEAAERGNETKRALYASGKIKNWTDGKTKETDPRIAQSAQKTSKTLKDSGMFKGEKNPAWMGGKSFEKYGVEFNEDLKEYIRTRDEHKCQVCGTPEIECNRKLTVHHIDYIKKNNSEVNLISLCNKCHGDTCFNREYWEAYFTKFMISKIQI